MGADGNTKTRSVRPVHEIVADMIKIFATQPYVIKAWAIVYANGAIVPPKSINPLAEAFEGSKIRFNGVESEIKFIDAAITSIRSQA